MALYAEVIGEPLIRNRDGLHSAVGRPRHSTFGRDAYFLLVLKAAALMQSLAENQSFVDGNKRIILASDQDISADQRLDDTSD